MAHVLPYSQKTCSKCQEMRRSSSAEILVLSLLFRDPGLATTDDINLRMLAILYDGTIGQISFQRARTPSHPLRVKTFANDLASCLLCLTILPLLCAFSHLTKIELIQELHCKTDYIAFVYIYSSCL